MPEGKPSQPLAREAPIHHHAQAALITGRVGLLLVGCAAALLLWFSLSAVFGLRAEGASALAASGLIGLAALGFVVVLAVFGFTVILNPHTRDHRLLVAATSLAVLASGLSVLTLAAMALVVLALLGWRQSMLREARDRIRFSFYRTMRRGLGLTLAVLALAIAIQSVTPAQLLLDPQTGAGRLLDATAAGIERALPWLVPGVDTKKPLDEYLAEVVTSLAEGRTVLVPFPGFKIEGVPTAPALRQQLSENLGVALTGRETLGDVIQRTVRERLTPIVMKTTAAIVPLFILSLFLALQIVNPLLGWLAVGVAALACRLAQASGWVKIVRQVVEVDRLSVG